MTERALQAKVMKWLKTLPRSSWDNNSPSRWARKGIADITGCEYQYELSMGWGQFWAMELKQPGKYKDPHEGLESEQILWLEHKQKAGALCVVADSLETVKECIHSRRGNFSAERAWQLHRQQQESRASKRRARPKSCKRPRGQSSC